MITISPLASGSRGNCYHATDGKTPLLLECGIGIQSIRRWLNFKLSSIAGVLISHEHKDHCRAVLDVMWAGVDCYMSQGTAEALGVDGHRVKIVRPKEQFKVGTWTALPFSTQHDAADPLGFLLASQTGDKLLFATDTYYVRYKFRGLNYIMVECNYSLGILQKNAAQVPLAIKKRILRSHFSLENVKEFLKANDLSKVQEIWLLHLSDDNSDAEYFKREIQKLTGKMVFVAGSTNREGVALCQ